MGSEIQQGFAGPAIYPHSHRPSAHSHIWTPLYYQRDEMRKWLTVMCMSLGLTEMLTSTLYILLSAKFVFPNGTLSRKNVTLLYITIHVECGRDCRLLSIPPGFHDCAVA